MTVKELFDMVKSEVEANPNALVILQSDPEGNSYYNPSTAALGYWDKKHDYPSDEGDEDFKPGKNDVKVFYIAPNHGFTMQDYRE